MGYTSSFGPRKSDIWSYYDPEYHTSEDPAAVYAYEWEMPREETNTELVAEIAAKDYYRRHAWEHSWPLVIVVLKRGVEVGTFEVSLDMAPTFTATALHADRGQHAS